MRRCTATLTLVLMAACGSKGGTDEDAATDTAVEIDGTDVETETWCLSNADCDDGDECTTDTCNTATGWCQYENVCPGCGSDADCDDDDVCTTDTCNATTGDCAHDPVDADEDGYPAVTVGTTDCGGTDCDDTRDDVHPDHDPVCDGEDHDCTGVPDRDEDGDGYLSETTCPDTGDDCNDADPAIHPGAETACSPTDDLDCNGTSDFDNDNDTDPAIACGGGDCDDTDPGVSTLHAEVCNDGIDQDCDTLVDGPAAGDVSITISDAPGTHAHSSIAWSGSEFGVAWARQDSSLWSIRFARVSADGVVQGSALTVSDGTEDSGFPSLVWAGSRYAVAWEQVGTSDTEIHLDFIPPDGSSHGTDIDVTSNTGDSDRPWLAWTGSALGVTWQDRSTGSWRIHFTRLSASGAPIGSEIHVSPAGGISELSRLLWTGSEYAAFWRNMTGGVGSIQMRRVAADATLPDTSIVLISPYTYMSMAGVAWTGSEFGISWPEGSPHLKRADPTGTSLSSPLDVDAGSTGATHCSCHWTGSEFIVTWGNGTIEFASVDGAGTVASPSATLTLNAMNPAGVWTGTKVGVTHDDSGDVLQMSLIEMCD